MISGKGGALQFFDSGLHEGLNCPVDEFYVLNKLFLFLVEHAQEIFQFRETEQIPLNRNGCIY